MTGAEQARSEPQSGMDHGALTGAQDWLGSAEIESGTPTAPAPVWQDAPPAPRRSGMGVGGGLLLLLALGWVGAAAWAIYQTRPALTFANIVSWAGAVSGPLVLLGIVSVSYTHLTLPTKRIV